jgi:ATP-dependent DNA helicase RecG
VPFDDRVNHHTDLHDLKLPLMRSFLKEVKSELYSRSARMPFATLGRPMAIIDGPEEAPKPRNVGLLFFSEAPERFFPGTQIDVVYFPTGAGGDRLEEQIFRGPVHQQLRDALRHLRNRVLRERVTKVPDRAECARVFNFPFPAVEEALVNAVYHRGYDQREPVEVRISPQRIEVVSYPGPDPSIRREALKGDRIVARRYRNRRIGAFLKELDLTEGRSTGIPKIRESMRKNGSPPPRFDTDEGRTYFLVELPVHPAFLEAHDEAHVGLTETERRILQLLRDGPKAAPEIAAGLGYQSRSGHLKKALDRLGQLELVSLTIPDKPRSKNQKRQLTAKGRRVLERPGSPHGAMP